MKASQDPVKEASTMKASQDPAVIAEVTRIKEIVDRINPEVVLECEGMSGRGDTYTHGTVRAEFPAKGNNRLIKALEAEGYSIYRRKAFSMQVQYDGYTMIAEAAKRVRLETPIPFGEVTR